MIQIQNLTYIHPNKDLLFNNLNLTIQKNNKIALIGNNGIGKSTLLKLIAAELSANDGSINVADSIFYVPQHFGQYNNQTIAECLKVDKKLKALQDILNGEMTEINLEILGDDWAIEERCAAALEYWCLPAFPLSKNINELSGGQKTKVFLAGIQIHQPNIILFDEPSNHLDLSSRNTLYQFIESSNATILMVSHDRKLLNLLPIVYELSTKGISIYGGNYDFYLEQKEVARNAIEQNILNKEKAIRKAKEIERETLERKQKLDARGKKKQEKAGTPTIVMNTLRNNAERSTAKTKDIHQEKISSIGNELTELRKAKSTIDHMKFNFDQSNLHQGKVLISANNINYAYQHKPIWSSNLNLEIRSGQRIAITGNNGSGKTTLLKLILGKLNPSEGSLSRATFSSVYVDQEYSLLDTKLSILEQAEKYNHATLPDHELKIRLTRFLFSKEHWGKNCNSLSGGEKMRLLLCCLNISNKAPDLLILDEPTNNLDIQNTEILTQAIQGYKGTLLVISHDEYFLTECEVSKYILCK